MKKYIIDYYFDGAGKCRIAAKNETEAREKFFSGEFEAVVEDWGENYNVETITEEKKLKK